jgi:hypothetical protein
VSDKKTFLTRDQILSIQDIEIEEVEVPEWGGAVYVRGMSGTERDQFEGSIVTQRGKSTAVNMANIRAKLAAVSICDADGKRLFTERDAKALGEKSAAALQRIFEVARRLSGIGDEDIEELAEGLEKDPFDDSPTA